ncbi:MAG: DNA methyltransferase [Victivallales bacterium]
MSFRGRLTQTQYNKIIQQWEGIASKPKPELADLLWKSIDIKEVNKGFYAQIKESFDAIVGILNSENVKADDSQKKQFAVRLIGRYMFCWFLKEKGIMPAELISSRNIRNTEGYYQNTLLKLFFYTLNTKVPDRVAKEEYFEKIPYLNGGLFDESDDDKLFRSLDLDAWLVKFVEVLENYDFTVDESSSAYQHVAVDPEMLGRIFENLLASQNPETEKFANERKSFGAFYTPREIVDFMVNESIKTYLAQKLAVDASLLESAFSANPVWPEKLKKRKLEAEAALKDVKILDPACGSGAFPIGVLHKLINLREMVEVHPDTYHLKKEILSNNIYGIDIMPMAVEIARLRAWLSLIVDEDYLPDKPMNNFGIDALPNLDFKFMQGNSLLETYEGIKLFDEKLLEADSASRKQELIERTKKKLDNLQSSYIKLHNENKLKGVQKAVLDKELKENNAFLKKIQVSEKSDNYYGLFDLNSKSVYEKLKKLQDDYFKISDREQKLHCKGEIEKLEWDLIATTLNEDGESGKLKKLENMRKKNSKPYFLYKLNFSEVFTDKKGFDIVIGNPPYVRQEAIDPDYKPLYIQNHPEVGSGTADLYVYFFDSALSVVNPGGIVIFITLNKFLKTKYGEGLRKKLKDKNVDLIIDFYELPVFEASTDTAITKIINMPDTDNTKYFPVKSLEDLDLNALTKGEPLKVIKDGTEWKFIEKSSEIILGKIYQNTISLKEFTCDKIFRGIISGFVKAFELEEEDAEKLLNSESKSIVKPFIRSTDITKYSLKDKNKFFLITGFDINVPELYPSAYKHLRRYEDKLRERQDQGENWYNLRACAYYEEFEKPKLVYIYTAKKQEFYLDTEGRYINNNCYMIISDNKYLFFFLNSILFDWFKRIKFVAYGDADEAGRVKLDYNKMITVPIRQIPATRLKWFEQKYTEIKKSLSNQTKVKSLENEVELMLFKIYDLTYKEVKTVCPDFWLRQDEYEKHKSS